MKYADCKKNLTLGELNIPISSLKEKIKMFQLVVGDNLHLFSRGNMAAKTAN